MLLLVLGIAGVGGFVLLGGGDGGGLSPEQTVRDFVDAIGERDCAGAVELMYVPPDRSSEEAVENCEASFVEGEGGPFGGEYVIQDAEPVSESGDMATVRITASLDGQDLGSHEVTLRRVDDAWRVEFGSGSNVPDTEELGD